MLLNYELLASCNMNGLAAFFRELNMQEKKIMEDFGYVWERESEQVKKKEPKPGMERIP